MAVLLSLPSFALPFLWDDFDFLARTNPPHLQNFLPSPSDNLYRPVSRDAYFTVVNLVARGSPLLAHIMNAVLAGACCLLLVSFIRRFSNPRAGLIGGLIFAAAAAIPFLIGWISGSQDLLCFLFSLGAYHFFASGRIALGTMLFAAAIFSKETAVALTPAILVITIWSAPEWRSRVLKASVGLAAVLGIWATLHPWVHGSLTHQGARGVNQYVAFQGAGAIGGLVRGLPSLFNLSWARDHRWHLGVIASAILASVVVFFAIRRAWNTASGTAEVETRTQRALLAIGVLTILGPFLLTSAFIAHWSVYYAGISVMGLAMVTAPILSRASWFITTLTVTAFLWIGAISRMAVIAPEVPAEQNLRETAQSLQRIKRELKALEPSLPHGAGVYIYVQAPGTHGGYDSIYKNQPLKTWYGDSSIEVRDPLLLLPAGREEFLFWISPKFDVFEIDPRTLQARSPGPAASFPEYQKTLRAFALGLAGRGETDRAVSILTGMLQFSDYLKAYDRRSAAALLYAADRDEEAGRLLDSTASFPRTSALSEVTGLIAKPIPGIDLDEGALRAFGLAPTDTSAVREVMRSLERGGYGASANRFAHRLLRLVPMDAEAARVLARTEARDT